VVLQLLETQTPRRKTLTNETETRLDYITNEAETRTKLRRIRFLLMPRGGKRKGAGGTRKGAGGKRKGAGGERKGAGAPLGNVNGVENTGGAAPLGNLNGLGNTGGAATVGNTNSSSREKKISSLLAVGLELDRHGAFNEAMSKYREILELDPMHADTHYSIGRLLSRLFYQRDLVNSGPFPLIVEHLRIADRGGCKQAKNCLCQVLLNGNHVGELGECRPHPMDFEEVLEHYKLVVAKVEAEIWPHLVILLYWLLHHLLIWIMH
jgi:hypothetical protein